MGDSMLSRKGRFGAGNFVRGGPEKCTLLRVPCSPTGAKFLLVACCSRRFRRVSGLLTAHDRIWACDNPLDSLITAGPAVGPLPRRGPISFS